MTITPKRVKQPPEIREWHFDIREVQKENTSDRNKVEKGKKR